jgi:hypothetical protein
VNPWGGPLDYHSGQVRKGGFAVLSLYFQRGPISGLAPNPPNRLHCSGPAELAEKLREIVLRRRSHVGDVSRSAVVSPSNAFSRSRCPLPTDADTSYALHRGRNSVRLKADSAWRISLFGTKLHLRKSRGLASDGLRSIYAMTVPALDTDRSCCGILNDASNATRAAV